MTQITHSNSIPQRLRRLPRSGWQASRSLHPLLVGLVFLTILWWGYAHTSRPVTLVINGQSRQINTHNLAVSTILREMEISLESEDIVEPPPEATLSAGNTLSIKLARPVIVEADGKTWQTLTHRQRSNEVLAELGLALNPRDVLFINGQQATPDTLLPDIQPETASPGYRQLLAKTTPAGAIDALRPEAVRLVVRRAVPVTLYNGQTGSPFFTAASTVGQALLEQGITLFSGDKVTPGQETQLSPGMSIYIVRATPVTIYADGQTIKTRTHRKTVGEILAEEGVALMGQDFSRPPLNQPVSANDSIEIVRVHEAVEVEETFIPFETKRIPDDEMELDRQEIRQEGATGIIKTRHRVRYENGQEMERVFEDEWLDQEPGDRVVAYGTKITVRTLDTPDGPIEYWRKISMRATAYSAATSGKAPDHPLYGITRSGLQAGYGIVAVDTRVIPLMTNLYVEDYGPAVAGDTGGRILGKHIDLGHPDDAPLPVIFEWRDVYLLTPVPPADQIRYVLPNWPQRN